MNCEKEMLSLFLILNCVQSSSNFENKLLSKDIVFCVDMLIVKLTQYINFFNVVNFNKCLNLIQLGKKEVK